VEILKFIEKVLNEMTFFVECSIVVSLFFSVPLWQKQVLSARACAGAKTPRSNFRPEQYRQRAPERAIHSQAL